MVNDYLLLTLELITNYNTIITNSNICMMWLYWPSLVHRWIQIHKQRRWSIWNLMYSQSTRKYFFSDRFRYLMSSQNTFSLSMKNLIKIFLCFRKLRNCFKKRFFKKLHARGTYFEGAPTCNLNCWYFISSQLNRKYLFSVVQNFL